MAKLSATRAQVSISLKNRSCCEYWENSGVGSLFISYVNPAELKLPKGWEYISEKNIIRDSTRPKIGFYVHLVTET